ncbi:exported hypothetical protein [uncultured Defluviicoccus sp.]|uniref:Uncharacterized protein n=1 Tax=metagenome TaxID=256318 RepID=A0A380TI69_9ZZZZ|nr:exported hypothetical protein [uncultured Defluviicoccus sp.]
MRAVLTGVILSALLFCSDALALTAVCREPQGRVLGVHGLMGEGKEVDEVDGMTGGLFTLIWDGSSRRATLITQGAGGGAPNTEDALVVHNTKGKLSVLVLYEGAVWLYSLYPEVGRLLITAHQEGLGIDAGGALAKVFQAQCEVSSK